MSLDSFVLSQKHRNISSNSKEFLVDSDDCARLRPRLIERHVQMRQGVADLLDGPFMYTKIPWASLILTQNESESAFCLRSRFRSSSPMFGILERLVNIENLFLPLPTNIVVGNIIKRIEAVYKDVVELTSEFNIDVAINDKNDSFMSKLKFCESAALLIEEKYPRLALARFNYKSQ